MEKIYILKSIRVILNLVTSIFFVIGAIGYITSPDYLYPSIMYLLSGAFHFIGSIFDIIIHFIEERINQEK